MFCICRLWRPGKSGKRIPGGQSCQCSILETSVKISCIPHTGSFICLGGSVHSLSIPKVPEYSGIFSKPETGDGEFGTSREESEYLGSGDWRFRGQVEDVRHRKG